MIVRIPYSKSSKKPVHVKVAAVKDKRVCPVTLMSAYLRVRPQESEGLLFVESDRSYLTATRFCSDLNKLCSAAGLVPLTPHAFRIGGVSWAAKMGWPDAVICAHGRWHSDAFIQYIRPV